MTTHTPFWITNVHVVLENDTIKDAHVYVENGRIQTIEQQPVETINGRQVDGKGGWLLPGMIDLHVHGGYGFDFMDGNHEAIQKITHFHATQGTTAMLATTITAGGAAIEKAIEAAYTYQPAMPSARLIGMHLEGPFISSKFPGAQNPKYIVPPQLDWLKRWEQMHPSFIKIVTLAPETEGALSVIKWLVKQGIVASAGHTDASYQQMEDATACGLDHAVHSFNAMRGLHHREPGTAGAVLEMDSIHAELIADGLHVHPGAIRLLTKAKPQDKLILITDAMSAAGLGDGDYYLGELDVQVINGEARLRGDGNLAGSTLTMIQALRNMKDFTHLELPVLCQYASLNPAKRLGIDHETGSIATGKRADLVLVDANFEIEQTWVGGEAVPALLEH